MTRLLRGACLCGEAAYEVEDGFAYSLVDEPTIRPTAHIHVGSKAGWERILDDLPQHDELP